MSTPVGRPSPSRCRSPAASASGSSRAAPSCTRSHGPCRRPSTSASTSPPPRGRPSCQRSSRSCRPGPSRRRGPGPRLRPPGPPRLQGGRTLAWGPTVAHPAKFPPNPCQNRVRVMLAARSARLELRLLGPLELLGPGGAVRPPGEKPAAVMAFLALHADEVVSRDRLVDALWDDDPPASAAASLQMHVSKARKLLDEAGAGRE